MIRNDSLSIQELNQLQFSSIVISPGPGTPAQSGILMEFIHQYHAKVPILGICLGHQALGQYFGASLVKAEKPMHGKTSMISTQNDAYIFKNLPSQMQVMRYHSLVLEDLKSPLKITAETELKEIMAFQHCTLPIAGLQFHPESILTPNGIVMLKNWFQYIEN